MPGIIKGRIYKKYEKESSKLKMVEGGAWTINLEKVNLFLIDIIIYETKKYVYSISSNQAQGIGSTMLLGGEWKLVIPLKYWKRLKKEQ